MAQENLVGFFLQLFSSLAGLLQVLLGLLSSLAGLLSLVAGLLQSLFSLDNIILGDEPVGSMGLLKKTEARRRIVELSEKYGLQVDPDAKIQDITVGMQQRTEILKML